MSERFAHDAAGLCGVVCRHLGWRPAEFWTATPLEITTIFSEDTPGGVRGIDRKSLDAMMERDAHG